MKRLFILSALVITTAAAYAKGDWKGRVVDEKGEPVAYANVAVLSKADSSVVCGAVTGEDGTYNIVTRENDGIMMVALLGYKTVYLSPKDGAIVTLAEDNSLLTGATATAIMPKTKLTGEGLQTNIRGSVLENAGTAADVLEKTPGLIKGMNGLEVIGKGAPLVYINGHKVTDSSELQRLQSNEIQSIEVITNPGAQYDATIRSVVRIKTIRRQGDGFGFSLNASDSQSLRWAPGNQPTGSINANYRTGGVDIFAGANYVRSTNRQLSDILKTTYGSTSVITESGDLEAHGVEQTLHGNTGINWQIADNHFLGGKIEWGRTLEATGRSTVNDLLCVDDTPTDQLATVTDDTIGDQAPSTLGANVYYNGVAGEKLGIDINLDYYGTTSSKKSVAEETSTISDASIQSEGRNEARLYAAKAVLSYPIWMGQLQAGTEESFTRRTDDYSITGITSIKASSASVVEDNYAAFASYAFYLPAAGQFNAGVRYEYVHYTYEDALTPANNLSRDYGNLFPTFSYAGAAGPVQMMFNYSAKTRRPDFESLSGAIRYNSRYMWQSGYAKLQPQLSHSFELATVWNFITLMVDYTRTDSAIMTWSEPYPEGGDGVMLVQPRNIKEPFRQMQIVTVFTPTIGEWNLNYALGVQPQWLSINVKDPREASGSRMATFNGKPVCFAQLDNTLRVKGGWQFELGSMLVSKGYTDNVYLRKGFWDLSAAVQKTLLKDGSLVLRLEGRDLAGKAHYDVDTDFGNHTIYQSNIMDSQRIKFSLRYNFNTAKSKYRGTGAGSDTKDRMK